MYYFDKEPPWETNHLRGGEWQKFEIESPQTF